MNNEKVRTERKKKLYAVANEIYMNVKYGELISYTELEERFGCSRLEPEFQIYMIALKEILSERGFILDSIMNEGYRILQPNEIADYVVRRNLLQSTNKLRRGSNILKHTDTTKLNLIELKYFNNISQIVEEALGNNERSLLSAQVMFNSVKNKEIAEANGGKFNGNGRKNTH